MTNSPGRVSRFWRTLGPGLITGAADDDPSGIATYSLAGAQFGTTLLWMPIVAFPLMWAVQVTCARIGMVTGRGLMAAMRQRFPRRLLFAVCGALAIANSINIGADLAGMADAVELLSGVNSHAWIVAFAVGILYSTIRLRYAQVVRVLKWLSVVLGAYFLTAMISHPDWGRIMHAVLIPRIPEGSAGWGMIVAIMGTTISPYLFFWQASQEVEEEKAIGRFGRTRAGATADELRARTTDVGVGAFVATFSMFFIMLTTAITLNATGNTDPQTSADVARALEPLAGRAAMLLYTIGIVAIGILAIPTLAGATAYAFSELLALRQGIDEQFHHAKAFYGIMGVSIAFGVAMDFLNINVVRALYWTAVLNGLLAPFLLLAIVLIAADAVLMRGQKSSRIALAAVSFTTVIMAAAGLAMFLV